MDWTGYLIVIATLLLAYIIRGMTGFGSAMVAVPILSQFWPVIEVVPGVMLLDYAAALWLSWGIKSVGLNKQEVKRLLPYSMVGCLVGAYLLLHTDNTILMVMLGGIVILFGTIYAARPNSLPVFSTRLTPFFGLTGGATGALFGVSAPPYIFYLVSRLRDTSAVRSTFSYLARFDGAFRILLMAYLGLLLNTVSMSIFFLGLVCAWCGVVWGDQLHTRCREDLMMRVTGVVIALLGVGLFYEAARVTGTPLWPPEAWFARVHGRL